MWLRVKQAPLLMATAIAMAYCGAVLVAEDRVPPRAPLFEGLGTFERKATTKSPDSQKYFTQGLCFLYAFNHDEAIRSFREAGRLDPKCAMAWWGVALANGPHINNPVVKPENAKAAWEALGKARELAGGTMRASAWVKISSNSLSADGEGPCRELY